MHSYAIRLKFNASDHAMDCEALLAGLVAFVNKGMKDLHVFIDTLTLVAQIEGNHTPTTEQERKYKEETMDATAPFHRFRITHLPKILNSKAETLAGLATIKLEFLNQEVSVGSAGWTTTHLQSVCPKLGATSVLWHTTRPSPNRKWTYKKKKGGKEKLSLNPKRLAVASSSAAEEGKEPSPFSPAKRDTTTSLRLEETHPDPTMVTLATSSKT
ncbi:reverse transcriptase domain-containing protein [Tanacetum coccineum]|uniref:Reverse transcriptase domain-containing protein n=1 Tax=Tanacetum coccineum TaxID=301880 RepID=A0ABQ5GW17_9ASTR